MKDIRNKIKVERTLKMRIRYFGMNCIGEKGVYELEGYSLFSSTISKKLKKALDGMLTISESTKDIIFSRTNGYTMIVTQSDYERSIFFTSRPISYPEFKKEILSHSMSRLLLIQTNSKI